MNVLRVRNLRQKVLFLHELQGQISDGHWENSRPANHWEIWCGCQVEIKPDDTGKSWDHGRKTYNLNDPDLLDVVGLRMLRYVRLALAYGEESVASLGHLFFCDEEPRLPHHEGDYWDGCRREIAETLGRLGVSLDHVVSVLKSEDVYQMRDLIADLKDLKQIMRS